MTAPDLFSIILAILAFALLLLSDKASGRTVPELSRNRHLAICIGAAALGFLARLIRLTTLPGGLSAEEALIAVQAKTLWQTGHFLYTEGIVAQLPQWTGEPAGPLLALLTAPFVGLLGMTTLSVRLPLALLSCAALPAAYLAGTELGGKRAGRWLLLFWALSPFFVLTARLTAAASLAQCIFPWALALSVRGLRRPRELPWAFLLLGLLVFTQNLYFYLSPVLIALLAALSLRYGAKWRLVLPSALLGLVICLPGILTAIACRTGGADISVGPFIFRHMEDYDKAQTLFGLMHGNPHPDSVVFSKLWAVLTGGLFQNAMHANVAYSLFATDGMTALGLFSVPLALAGALLLLVRGVSGKRFSPAVLLVLFFGGATLVAELLFGSKGEMEIYGTTSIWDHAQLFPYTVLLAVVALCRVQEHSRICAAGFVAVFVASFTCLCVALFGGRYSEGANIYFTDYPQAVEAGRQIQEKTGAKLLVTSSVYPHLAPEEAAQMMLYCIADADMKEAEISPACCGEIYWPEGEDEPQKDCIHVVLQREIRHWMWEDEDFDYETFGRYALLIPKRPD